MTHGLGPGKPGRRAAKPITPPYVENNYRIEVKITFMLIAYLVLLCEFFWGFSIFHICRPLVDIYWHPLLSFCKNRIFDRSRVKSFCIGSKYTWHKFHIFFTFIVLSWIIFKKLYQLFSYKFNFLQLYQFHIFILTLSFL